MSGAGELGMFLAIAAACCGFFFGPVGAAFGRRFGGPVGADPQALDELRARLDAAEQELARMSELEERLDFAERVLAQREPERIEAAETPVP